MSTDMPAITRYRPQTDPTGQAPILLDTVLDRTVSGTSADAAHAEELGRLARFLARLEHPAIPVVHDLVRQDGRVLLVTARCDGISLAQAILAARHGAAHPAIAHAVACATTFVRVCNALSFAHGRGIVHRNINPGTLLLDRHDGVLVDGWEVAMRRSGTAADPAPVHDDLGEDVRAVGSCLYAAAALTDAPPSADLLPDAPRRVPGPLLAIVRRALASNAAEGYRSMDELAADLSRFVDGERPLAYAPGPLAACSHWMHGHRGAAACLLILVLAALCGGAWLWLRDPGWGTPLASEDFSDDGWSQRWVEAVPGMFERQRATESIVSRSEGKSLLILRRRLIPPVAIEYTGTMLDGSRPCDLSILWSEHDGPPDDPAILAGTGRRIDIQAGAFENSYCAVFSNPGRQRLAHANVLLTPGRPHRFRVEVLQDRYRLWIDGQLTLDAADLMPPSSGYIALSAYYPGKAFDDVQVWQKDVPQLVSPLAIGDSMFQLGHFADAAATYQRIADSSPGTILADQALLRQGLSERRAGHPERSTAVWGRIADPFLRLRSEAAQITILADNGQQLHAEQLLRRLWPQEPRLHQDLRLAWQEVVRALMADAEANRSLLDSWFTLRQELFPQDDASGYVTGELLLAVQRYQDVLALLPRERRARAKALLALGRNQEVLDAGWAIPMERSWARLHRGDLEGVVADPTLAPSLRSLCLAKLGRTEEAVTAAPWPGLIHAGRATELLGWPGLPTEARTEALVATGQLAEAAAAGSWRALLLLDRTAEAEAVLHRSLPLHRLIDALCAGDAQAVTSWRRRLPEGLDMGAHNDWFRQLAIIPIVDRSLPATLAQAVTGWREGFGGRASQVASAALDPTAEAAIAGGAWRSEAQALIAIARAMRAELAPDRAGASTAWQAYLNLPLTARLLWDNSPNPDIERFARWRASLP